MSGPTTEQATHAAQQEWKPTPYAQRASQNLNFFGYVKDSLLRLVFGVTAGSFAGTMLGKALKFDKAGQNAMSLAGMVTGIFVSDFRRWQKAEAKRDDVAGIYQEYKSVDGLRTTNTELAADNALLKRMVEHQRGQLGEQPGAVTQGKIQRDGVAAEHEASRQH